MLNKGTSGFTSNTLLIPKQDQFMVQKVTDFNCHNAAIAYMSEEILILLVWRENIKSEQFLI